MTENKIRIGVIGIDHGHIYGQVDHLVDTGRAELVAWDTNDDTLAADVEQYAKKYPDVPRRERKAILEDETIDIIITAAVPADRAEIAIAAMKHGKDAMTDKPGCTTFAQLAELEKTVAETGRIWSVCFSERLNEESCTLADQLIAQGRIGDVIQTVGLGPHSLKNLTRPAWFFERERFGGILCDIAAHQFDQFLHFTGSTQAKVVTAQVRNIANQQYPTFQDYGDVVLEGNGGRGFARVDWFTPKGLPTWGDGRYTILGTTGTIEMRKYIDIGGKEGTNHVFLVDGEKVERFDATGAGRPYFGKLIDDVRDRTNTAGTQAHNFLAARLGLEAQALGEKDL